MHTTIEGIYENGKVILKESPPVKKNSKVLVTFISDDNNPTAGQKRKLGSMTGTIKMADDFNESLDDLSDYIWWHTYSIHTQYFGASPNITNSPQKPGTIIEDMNSVCYASAVSFFEMAIKKKTGKLELSRPVSQYFDEIQRIGIQILPIKPQYLDCYDTLPLIDGNRDPFDRILIATAIEENLQVLTIDEKFTLYDNLQVIW